MTDANTAPPATIGAPEGPTASRYAVLIGSLEIDGAHATAFVHTPGSLGDVRAMRITLGQLTQTQKQVPMEHLFSALREDLDAGRPCAAVFVPLR